MSLTLLQMSNFITGKVGQYDDVSARLCKDYIRARYKMVWDAYLWRDSQMIAQGHLDAQKSFLTFPDDMERVISIRAGADIFLDPVDDAFLLETDPTIFNRYGIPVCYTELIPFVIDDSASASQVRILPATDGPYDFYIFGKRKCPELTNDSGVSILRNCDNVIIAYAMGDMLERLRQYQKAQAKFTEAAALMQEAQQVDTQQSNKPRSNKQLSVSGATLGEMADAVCAAAGSWGPDTRILAREFIRRNYISIYNMTLWPESTVVVRITRSDTVEQVVLPYYLERVVNVRGESGFMLMPADVTYLFAVSPQIFDQTGTSASFSILPSVGAALPPVREYIIALSSSPYDVGKHIFIRGEIQGFEVTEEIVLGGLAAISTPPGTLPSPVPPEDPLAPAPPDPDIPDSRIGVSSHYAYDTILTAGKGLTYGNISLSGATSGMLLQMIPGGDRERRMQRIWLQPQNNSTDTKTYLVLGKRRIYPLRTDEDYPILTGASGAIIAASAADLMSRLGNAQGSAEQRQKANAEAQALLSVNMDQQAYAPKLVPMIEPSALGAYADPCWSK